MKQVLFKDGLFQWKRLENLILLAREQVTMMNRNTPLKNSGQQVHMVPFSD
jgi:aarF domain-containing kinase